MAQALVELGIAGRLLARATARRALGRLPPVPDRRAFRRELETVLAATASERIRCHAWIELAADQPPWVPTGLELAAGDVATWFACGRVYVAKALDIWAPPALQLWGRVGSDGHVFSGTRDTHTLTSETGGELFLGNYFPNDWSTRDGQTVSGPEVYDGARGGMTILVVVWRGYAMEGLRSLVRSGDAGGPIEGEIARLEQRVAPPPDWHYLWHVGEAEIFSQADPPDGGVRCHTHRDVGILQHDVDLEFTPGTRITWRWKVDELPSRLREDTTPTHDYLSIAVEFDNGLDLSYYWSARLPEETFYACPLENWKDKETHLVVRSGTEELGTWLEESRNLYDDYQRAIGKPASRITRVWFIAVSLFQRGTGRCEYADIRVSNDSATVVVL